MKITGNVVQIIKWEERESYFNVVDSDTPHDLIVVSSNTDVKKSKWGRYVDSFKSKPTPLDKFTLEPNISMWVQRPHKYSEGSNVDVEINLHVSN